MEARQQRKIVEFLFGGSIPAEYKSAREVYEQPSSAPMQCRTVIKAAKNNFPDSAAQYEVCWLCGLPFTPQINRILGNSICEHVLPIIQAVMYIGLFYRPYYLSLKSEAEAEAEAAVGGAGAIGGAGAEDDDMYKLVPQTKESYLRSLYNEYRYAHHDCNSLKSDKLFIYNNPDTGLFEMNEVLIEELLSEIYNKASAAFNKRYTEETFIKERETAIGNVIFPIITRMNGEFEDAEKKKVYAPNLSQLAAAAALITYPSLEEEGIAGKLIIGAGPPAIDPPQIACQIIKQVTDIYNILFETTPKSKSKVVYSDEEYEEIKILIQSASTIKAPIFEIIGELNACCTPGKACTSPLYKELLAYINKLATIGISSQFELTSIKQNLISTIINNIFNAALPAASVSGSRTRTIPLSKEKLRLLEYIQLALQREFVEDNALLLKLVASENICGTNGPGAGVTTNGNVAMTNGAGQYASKEEAKLLWDFSQGVKQSRKNNKTRNTRKGPKQQNNNVYGKLRREKRAYNLTAKRKGR